MRKQWKSFRVRGRRAGERIAMEPERRLADLDEWVGLWVAVKDGKVIAAAHSSRELVPKLAEMGPAGRGAVAQFVPRPSDTIVVGVG